MVDRHDDPLAALQRAWSQVEPPAPARELGDEDATTRAVVDWMRGAFDALEPPAAVPVPTSGHGPGHAPSHAPSPSPSLSPSHGHASRHGPEHVPHLRAVPRRAPERQQAWRRQAAAAALLIGLALALGSRPDRLPTPPDTPPTEDAPRLVAVTDDHLVMRSGPVRLVLVTSTPDASDPR